MRYSDGVTGIFSGAIMAIIGTTILRMEKPTIGIHGFAGPTFPWVGWMLLIFGILMIAASIYGLFFNRKKRLAALARCKALRKQEAEAAKTEDNQHP